MCLDQKCLPVSMIKKVISSRECRFNCSGNGVCNSLGTIFSINVFIKVYLILNIGVLYLTK